MNKSRYNRNKPSKKKRYAKKKYAKKKYAKKIKKTLNKRGGGGRGAYMITESEYNTLVDPSFAYNRASNVSGTYTRSREDVGRINVLDRIYGENAVALNNELLYSLEFKPIRELRALIQKLEKDIDLRKEEIDEVWEERERVLILIRGDQEGSIKYHEALGDQLHQLLTLESAKSDSVKQIQAQIDKELDARIQALEAEDAAAVVAATGRWRSQREEADREFAAASDALLRGQAMESKAKEADRESAAALEAAEEARARYEMRMEKMKAQKRELDQELSDLRKNKTELEQLISRSSQLKGGLFQLLDQAKARLDECQQLKAQAKSALIENKARLLTFEKLLRRGAPCGERPFDWAAARAFAGKLPKLLFINAHGYRDGDSLTLIPENKELYLTVGEGEGYVADAEDTRWTGVFGSSRYLNCFTGLIADYDINFDLSWERACSGPRDAPASCRPLLFQGGIWEVQPKVCEGILDEKKFLTSITEELHPIRLTDDVWLKAHGITKVSGQPTKYNAVEPEAADHYLSQILENHNYDIISRQFMEYYILGSIVHRKDGSFYRRNKLKLSSVLQFIEEASLSQDLPNKILGTFCRSGEGTLNIDTFLEHSRLHPMEPLGPLTVEYFHDKISYEGTNLTRQKSLASYHKIQNFWSIYHNVIKNKGSLEEQAQILVDGFVSKKINERADRCFSKEPYRAGAQPFAAPWGIRLEISDACLIFQCDNYLMRLVAKADELPEAEPGQQPEAEPEQQSEAEPEQQSEAEPEASKKPKAETAQAPAPPPYRPSDILLAEIQRAASSRPPSRTGEVRLPAEVEAAQRKAADRVRSRRRKKEK